MEKLFTYGSLQDRDVQIKLFNRELSGVEDVLSGYEKGEMEVSGKTFNIAAANSEGKIDGIVYDLSPEEIERADRYEGKGYKRVKIVLLSGIEAWVYLHKTDKEMYEELSAYTLNLEDEAFIHQHVVDAYAAQHATLETKPISIAFALAGLYLYLEKGYTGRQVQLAHMKMAEKKQEWPTFAIPSTLGNITVQNVYHTKQGHEREEMIHAWCESVWSSWEESKEQVRNWATQQLNIK